jgi:hypothetical protein
MIDKLEDFLGTLHCNRCLHDERKRAIERELVEAAISDDQMDDYLYRHVRRVAWAFS